MAALRRGSLARASAAHAALGYPGWRRWPGRGLGPCQGPPWVGIEGYRGELGPPAARLLAGQRLQHHMMRQQAQQCPARFPHSALCPGLLPEPQGPAPKWAAARAAGAGNEVGCCPSRRGRPRSGLLPEPQGPAPKWAAARAAGAGPEVGCSPVATPGAGGIGAPGAPAIPCVSTAGGTGTADAAGPPPSPAGVREGTTQGPCAAAKTPPSGGSCEPSPRLAGSHWLDACVISGARRASLPAHSAAINMHDMLDTSDSENMPK